ncbi:MAG TPA: hypothetical protein VMG34_08175 [Bacteroidota bacterium]|nr:hypothetical protein [Bacteroidota bacterium]
MQKGTNLVIGRIQTFIVASSTLATEHWFNEIPVVRSAFERKDPGDLTI